MKDLGRSGLLVECLRSDSSHGRLRLGLGLEVVAPFMAGQPTLEVPRRRRGSVSGAPAPASLPKSEPEQHRCSSKSEPLLAFSGVHQAFLPRLSVASGAARALLARCSGLLERLVGAARVPSGRRPNAAWARRRAPRACARRSCAARAPHGRRSLTACASSLRHLGTVRAKLGRCRRTPSMVFLQRPPSGVPKARGATSDRHGGGDLAPGADGMGGALRGVSPAGRPKCGRAERRWQNWERSGRSEMGGLERVRIGGVEAIC